ncbi:unnamed protein product, partial [Discosporangium mesarthrocarpum]
EIPRTSLCGGPSTYNVGSATNRFRTTTMVLDGSAVGGAGFWTAASHAFASSTSLILAADEEPTNIYAPIAFGGLVIVLSGIVGAYIVSILVNRMPPETLAQLAEELGSGDQKDSIEAEGVALRKRMVDAEREASLEPPGPGASTSSAAMTNARVASQTEEALKV